MLPMNVLKFANGNEDVKKVYEQMSDYYNHYTFANTGKRIGEFDDTVSLSEKADAKPLARRCIIKSHFVSPIYFLL